MISPRWGRWAFTKIRCWVYSWHSTDQWQRSYRRNVLWSKSRSTCCLSGNI